MDAASQRTNFMRFSTHPQLRLKAQQQCDRHTNRLRTMPTCCAVWAQSQAAEQVQSSCPAAYPVGKDDYGRSLHTWTCISVVLCDPRGVCGEVGSALLALLGSLACMLAEPPRCSWFERRRQPRQQTGSTCSCRPQPLHSHYGSAASGRASTACTLQQLAGPATTPLKAGRRLA